MVNTVFFGTHQFSIFALQVLKNNPNINLVAVVTTTDKKIGRDQTLTASPVKLWAIENNVKVIELSKSQGLSTKTLALNDLGVISYFGYLIPKNIIDKFNLGILNIHPSLLPDYKGAAPLEWALLNGENKTGVTLIKINEKFDKGEIIDQFETNLDYSRSKGEIYKDLFTKGAELLQNNLDAYITGNATLKPQKKSGKLAPMLTKQDGFIDLLSTDENLLKRKILALNPWPSTYTTLQNIADFKKLKPLKNADLKIQILDSDLKKLKPEGKNVMNWEEFKNGYLI